jgi:hypothetical protein
MRFAVPRRVLTVLPQGRRPPRYPDSPPFDSHPPSPGSEPQCHIGIPPRSIVDSFEPEDPLLVAHYQSR